MDDQAPNENPLPDFNKIDLTQLQGFSFGTQWTQDKGSSSDSRDSGERSRRDPRPDSGGPGGDKRDRRAFRKPGGDAPRRDFRAGEPARGDGPRPGAPGPGGPYGNAPRGDTGPAGGPAGGGRRDGGQAGGPRRDRDGGGDFRGGFRRPGQSFERQGPYDSPYFVSSFYPEDASFAALVKTIRGSARTIELFEIARTVLGKSDRFVVVVARRPIQGAAGPVGASSAPGPIFVSVPDTLPFENEEAAVGHVLARHLGTFFDTAEVEIDPPKGNYLVINKCGVTGELLGPPNYHRYNQIVQQHHAARVARMNFEGFRARIETVRDPEVVKQWLDKMRKVVRYTWKLPVAEGQAVPSFDNTEDARAYLLGEARDKVVRAVESLRMHGKDIEALPEGEIRMAIEGALERQCRFPLDTANVLRGRLRREHLTIFKKGSKGVSYVCGVKRKFRVPGQVFSQSIGDLIAYVEANPMVKAADLAAKFLGIAPTGDGASPSPADRERVVRMQSDLIWLVREGYVTEFMDSSLYAPPAVAEARKREAEGEENDPENYPEPQAASAAEAAAEGGSDASVPSAGEPVPSGETVAAESSSGSEAPAAGAVVAESPVAGEPAAGAPADPGATP